MSCSADPSHLCLTYLTHLTLQAWGSLTEVNLAGNKVHKFEGYRYYMSKYAPALKILDGVENAGDADEDNAPSNPLKVKPLADVKRYYEMKRKLMANPELMAKAAAAAKAADAAAEEGDDDDEALMEAVVEEKDEEDPEGFVRVLISDLTAQLTRCFEGPKVAQAIMQRIDSLVDKILDAPIEARILFTKAHPPEEAIEDFVQTMVVVLERDEAMVEPCLTIMTKLLAVVNQGIGARCLVQLRDLLQSSLVMSELGGPLLVEILFPRFEDPQIEVKERDQLIEAIFQIEHPEVSRALPQIIKILMELIKDREDRPSEALLGIFIQAVTGEGCDLAPLAQIFRKDRLPKDIIELLQEFKTRIGREDEEDKIHYSQLLKLTGTLSAMDGELAQMFVRAAVHLTLLDQMKNKMQDPQALMFEETLVTIGEIIAAIGGLCKDKDALDQAIGRGFLTQLTVCLAIPDLPPKVISTAYRSLYLVLTFAVPDPLEDQIPDDLKKPRDRVAKYHELVRENAIQVYPTYDTEKDASGEDWMLTRTSINEVKSAPI